MSQARLRDPGRCGSLAGAPALLQAALLAALLATALGSCGPLPNLLFASPTSQLNKTIFEEGTQVKYNCRPGYSRTSSHQVVVCKRSGRWEYSQFCIKKRCQNPGELRNGHVVVKTDLSFGAQLEFICSEGYLLIGPTTSYCEVYDNSVNWSDPLPECVIAQCEPPPAIPHGRHNGGDQVYTYGSSVTYSCDPTFSMLGRASISCAVKNKTISVWSPSPPTCKKVNCPYPEIKDGKVASGFRQSYAYKDSVSLTCNEGFILRGSSLLRCGDDSKWDHALPTCELNSCVGLPNIPHSSWMYRRPRDRALFAVGTVLQYSCHLGYKPVADRSTEVTCQKNLSWTLPTSCEEICCPIPELKNDTVIHVVRHTSSSSCTYSFRDTVEYWCSEEFKFSATCQADGTWDPQAPSCDNSCHSPPVVAHGHYDLNIRLFREKEVVYSCNSGYALVGKKSLSCKDSRWLGEPPKCRAQCQKPVVGHGRLSVERRQYQEPETLSVQCDPGYELVGSQNITCSENKTWAPAVPKCEWVFPKGCEQVVAGRKILQCLPNPDDVRMALDVYKLFLEIEQLELQRNKGKESMLASEL
ncbi:C4b-binding protein alpha chain-like [Talpa occidentalis]|uniref:C4b-binding protein alpha chain-like n=1 Tax=Talpa occidentalis TaxID=50954 RepID=UPI00188F4E71|nr:C4b-binding protein alpha chain-like [Talpa occidentalis]